MKTFLTTLTLACALFATSAANAAVVRIGVGPVRVGVRTAPVRRAYVAPRRAAARPVARAATRAVVHHRRHAIWDARH